MLLLLIFYMWLSESIIIYFNFLHKSKLKFKIYIPIVTIAR